ncbi:glycosyltransferase family 2 protein [Sulfurirhabdus autotrophica]|nr:glycosyltransferase family 2 protein [Sulfurirhabdus autotrophica]
MNIFISKVQIAILIPCYNEALTIERVIGRFRQELPAAQIFVYDNCSTDDTSVRAMAAGAFIRREPWPGKGNVVRRMFAEIEADVYIMVDGDSTYDPSVAPEMVRLLIADRLDMVVGTRRNVYSNAHRIGHGFGNSLFNGIYRRLFGPMFSDIFSGYRVFSRRFVKSFPAISSGFEIETELSAHASQIRMPIAELQTEYGAREDGSVSKLRTFRDAFRILWTMFLFFKEIQPTQFFGTIAVTLAFISIMLGYPLLEVYMNTGLVPRFPTAILATGLMLMAAIALVSGLILDSVARGRLENKRLHYLNLAQLRPREKH